MRGASSSSGSGTKLRGGYTPLDYSGDQDAPKTFTYGDTRYERFTRVVSSAKGGYYSADIQWDFIQKPWGFLGLIVGAKAIDVDVNVVDVADNVREVDTYRDGRSRGRPRRRASTAGKFSFEGEISGLTVGDRGNVFDTHGMARFHVSDRLALQGGYRLLRITGNEGDAEVNLRLQRLAVRPRAEPVRWRRQP